MIPSNWHRARPRLLPILVACCLTLALLKGEALWRAGEVGTARAASPTGPDPLPSPTRPTSLAPTSPASGSPASGSPASASPAPGSLPAAAAAARALAPVAEPPAPESAEVAILGALRSRRAEIEGLEAALAAREAVLAAAERRLTGRLDELAAIQARLQAADRVRAEREEGGWRALVRTYEAMRPRDAAAVFDDLEMPVLVGIVARMREAKAAPILGAMRPDRVRPLTAELSRHRAGAEAAP